MNPNQRWKLFFIALFLILLGWAALTSYKIYHYTALTSQIKAATATWSIRELSEETFVPEVTYTFFLNGKAIEGKTVLEDLIFRNAWAAEQAFPIYSTGYQTIWYSPSNVTHSTVYKKFPMKESLSSLFLAGLFIYFIWLRSYVVRLKS